MYRQRWMRLAGGVLGLTLITAVQGADSDSTVKALFTAAAKEVVNRSSIPLYIPASIQSLDSAAKDGCAFAESERDSFIISIYGRLTEYGKTEPLPCEENEAALLAVIHGESRPMPELSRSRQAQRVTLKSGLAGWFVPVSCGGSCAPAMLYWQTPQASYWLQIKLASTLPAVQQRKELLDTVDTLSLVSRNR